jgi:phosphoserine phosphatase
MTREEIIEMVEEAGPIVRTPFDVWCRRFAALVAAAEREACAKVCEETTAAWTQYLYNEGCMDCAKAIRTRGEQE